MQQVKYKICLGKREQSLKTGRERVTVYTVSVYIKTAYINTVQKERSDNIICKDCAISYRLITCQRT